MNWGDIPDGYAEGIAARSRYRIVAPGHLLVPVDGEYRTWCTDAPALRETPMYTAAQCRKCLALVGEYHAEYGEPERVCTCGTEEHPVYGTCRAPTIDCPKHEGR